MGVGREPLRTASPKFTRFPRPAFYGDASENELQSKLEQPGVAQLLGLSKSRTLVPRVAIRPVELSMIENVKNLRPEFQVHFLSNGSLLEYANIPIVDGRIAAKCAGDVAESSKRNSGRISRAGRSVAVVEQVRVEHEAVCPRIVGLERRGEIGLARTLKAQSASLQFCVIAIVDQDRETALIGINARNLPAVQHLAQKSLLLGNGQIPDVVENKAVPGVEQRRAVGGPEVQGIQDFLEARGVVQGLAVSIRSLELQAMGKALLQEGLQ